MFRRPCLDHGRGSCSRARAGHVQPDSAVTVSNRCDFRPWGLGLGCESTLSISDKDCTSIVQSWTELLADCIQQDVPALIKYSSRSATVHPAHQRTYRLAATVSIPLIASLLLFWLITHGQASRVIAWEILPQSYLVLLTILFLLPIQRLSVTGRYRFLSTLKRVSVGGIAEAGEGKFGDILLADVLTSYAKVLGDWFVAGCMFLSPGVSSTDKPDRGCGGAYLVPLIISIPSMIRLRQCLIEYTRVRKNLTATSGWGGQHLANALKYSTAFPVIILSALQRGYDPNKIGMSESGLFRLWYTALLTPLYRLLTETGCCLSFLIRSTLSIGMSPKIGTLPSSLLPSNGIILSTRGA